MNQLDTFLIDKSIGNVSFVLAFEDLKDLKSPGQKPNPYSKGPQNHNGFHVLRLNLRVTPKLPYIFALFDPHKMDNLMTPDIPHS